MISPLHGPGRLPSPPIETQPYRLFFPLGALAGVVGVGQWIFWSVGWSIPNVSLVHTTLQAQGFLASFVIGFLYTAFPRFTGSPPAPLACVAASFAAMIAFVAAAALGRLPLAQALFLTALAPLGAAMARSLLRRTKPLIGPFVLVAFGLAHAVAGPVLILASGFGERSPYAFAVGRQMIQLGFLLCAVLGVSGKLAPFLMGYTDDDPAKGAAAPVRGGRAALAFHAATGSAIAASFALEPLRPRWALALRAAAATTHLAIFARAFRRPRKFSATNLFFSISLWFVASGLIAEAAFPVYRVAALHLTFIGGFSLMIYSFGTLVVLSHSARAAELNGPLKAVWTVATMVLVALALRLVADLSAERYMGLIHASSSTWVIATLVWFFYALPKLRGNPTEEEECR